MTKNAPAATNTTPAAAPAAKQVGAVKRVAPELTAVSKAIPIPTNVNTRGSKSLYPFDSLTEVGMSFGMKNKKASSLASIVSNQNRKALEPKKDENGNIVYKQKEMKDASGNVTYVPTGDPEMVQTKKFQVADVDPKTDPEGAACRVWRIA